MAFWLASVRVGWRRKHEKRSVVRMREAIDSIRAGASDPFQLRWIKKRCHLICALKSVCTKRSVKSSKLICYSPCFKYCYTTKKSNAQLLTLSWERPNLNWNEGNSHHGVSFKTENKIITYRILFEILKMNKVDSPALSKVNLIFQNCSVLTFCCLSVNQLMKSTAITVYLQFKRSYLSC